MYKTGSLPELATVIFMKYGDLGISETREKRNDKRYVSNSNSHVKDRVSLVSNMVTEAEDTFFRQKFMIYHVSTYRCDLYELKP